MVGIPGWVMLLFVLLTAVGAWFALRGRVPPWLLVILTVMLAPAGGLLLTAVFYTLYASVGGG